MTTEQRYTLYIDGKPLMRGLTAKEADALVKVARQHRGAGEIDSGVRIETKRED